MSAGSSEVTDSHPISGMGARDTDPPTAAASNCPPKQIPSVGTPSEISDRAYSISSETQGIVTVSYTDQIAPKNTTASYSDADGNVTATSGEWNRSLGTTTISDASQPAAANASPISASGEL